jgi:1-deoxy-D-xylulose-5-phosphate synthase
LRYGLKNAETRELEKLSYTLRGEIEIAVAQNGGHLASNLGAVEITLAMHSVFDPDTDKLLFDVGHQAYAHKLLTGRSLSGLRKKEGISGFLSPSESACDAFVSGHSGTALSLAAGYLRAKKLTGADYEIVALVGDGAMTGGMSYEALNDLRTIGGRVVVILNDNGFPYGNGGIDSGFSAYLDDIKASKIAAPFKCYGAEYIGVIDGHDIGALTEAFKKAKESNGITVVHCITQKGKGCKAAEDAPERYHGLPRPSFGKTNEGITFSRAAGEGLTALATLDKRIVAVTAAMREGAGLSGFAERFPDRFFDVGICEAHAVTMSAAMSRGGLIPFAAVYSSFLQRGFDGLLHDVGIMNNNVKFLIDRAGLVAEDGETHQGIFDVGYLRLVPDIVILSPENTEELKEMIGFAAGHEGAVAIRYPKGAPPVIPERLKSFLTRPIGENAVLVSGAFAELEALIAAEICREKYGIETSVRYVKKLKPLDGSLTEDLKACKRIFTVEDNAVSGGFGSAAAEAFSCDGSKTVKIFAVRDAFPKRGTREELFCAEGLDGETLAKRIAREFESKQLGHKSGNEEKK